MLHHGIDFPAKRMELAPWSRAFGHLASVHCMAHGALHGSWCIAWHGMAHAAMQLGDDSTTAATSF